MAAVQRTERCVATSNRASPAPNIPGGPIERLPISSEAWPGASQPHPSCASSESPTLTPPRDDQCQEEPFAMTDAPEHDGSTSDGSAKGHIAPSDATLATMPKSTNKRKFHDLRRLSGKLLIDTYSKRSRTLREKAKELEVLTGAYVVIYTARPESVTEGRYHHFVSENLSTADSILAKQMRDTIDRINATAVGIRHGAQPGFHHPKRTRTNTTITSSIAESDHASALTVVGNSTLALHHLASRPHVVGLPNHMIHNTDQAEVDTVQSSVRALSMGLSGQVSLGEHVHAQTSEDCFSRAHPHMHTSSSMPQFSAHLEDCRPWVAEGLQAQAFGLGSRKQRDEIEAEICDALTGLANLAYRCCRGEMWKDAEVLMIQVVELSKHMHGPEHPETLTRMSNLAVLWCRQERWEEAQDLRVQVIQICRQAFGHEHPDTLTSMANFAFLWCKQGRWNDAVAPVTQITETSKQVLGLNHPDTLTRMAYLAFLWCKQRRWREAESLQNQVTEATKQVLGPEHPDTLVRMANLASLWWKLGRWDEAENLQVQVLTATKQVLGPTHPDTLTSMINLSLSHHGLGRWKEAESLQTQVMELKRQLLEPGGMTHIAHLISMYQGQKQWKEAEELRIQAKEMTEWRPQPEHLDTSTITTNLALTYHGQGKWEVTETIGIQLMERGKQALRPMHLDMSTSTANLAWKEAVTLQDQVTKTSKQML